MENNNTQNIQALLQQAIHDKNAAVSLLNIYRNDMLKEAHVYLKDGNAAKDAVIRAFRNAYKDIRNANAEDLGKWLNQYVQDECIKASLPLKKAESQSYTEADEIPAGRMKMPEENRIRKNLRAVLNKLDTSERIVSVLRFRDQYSFKEIAEKCRVSEDEVRYILTDAKKTITDAKGSLPVIFALVNHLYPYYKETAPSEEKQKAAFVGKLSIEEEEFNTELRELREFFNTMTMSTTKLSDHDIDDSEDADAENIDQTFEMRAIRELSDSNVNDTASSARMIMAAAMEVGSEKDVSEQEYDPKGYWFKRIVTGVLLAILAVGIGVAVAIIKSDHSDDKEPQRTAETETATPEATAETTPEPTEEAVPDDGSIGTAYILVTDLTMRKGPGVIYDQNGMAEPQKTYTVYEVTQADGYTWYRVGEDQWVPDLQSQFVTYTAKESE